MNTKVKADITLTHAVPIINDYNKPYTIESLINRCGRDNFTTPDGLYEIRNWAEGKEKFTSFIKTSEDKWEVTTLHRPPREPIFIGKKLEDCINFLNEKRLEVNL